MSQGGRETGSGGKEKAGLRKERKTKNKDSQWRSGERS